ncbi:signal peptidase II [Anaerolineales bacterium HSG25]|nr:signal peptidase II [Anaerolineales bacterium HSG25]
MINKQLIQLLIITLLTIFVDLLSKLWAEATLTLYDPVQIIGEFFRLTLSYNTGIAFSFFSNAGLLPLIVTGFVIIGLIVWFTSAITREELPPIAVIPVGMLLGGALGNFIDRLVDQRVTDFLDVGIGTTRWPTFNLADSFILIGLTLLVMLTYHPQIQADEAMLRDETFSMERGDV